MVPSRLLGAAQAPHTHELDGRVNAAGRLLEPASAACAVPLEAAAVESVVMPTRAQVSAESGGRPRCPQWQHRRRRNSWATDAVFEEGVERILHKLCQIGAGVGLDVREDGLGAPQYQATKGERAVCSVRKNSR